MSWRFIVCEGIDDLRAIRGIAQRCYGYTRWMGEAGRFRGQSEVLRVEGEDRVVEIANGRDRLRAAREARELLRESDGHIGAVGLLIDPDKDNDASLRAFVDAEALHELEWRPDASLAHVVHVESAFGETTPFTWLGWDTPRSFDGLPDDVRMLERTAIAILQDARPDDAGLVLQLLQALQDAGRATSWKTAHRLFNAVMKPATEVGFVDQVFGQDKRTRTHLPAVLAETVLGERLRWLLE